MAYHVRQFMTRAQIRALNLALQASITICAFVFLAMIVLAAFQ
jgi:hypothetical protein